MRQESITLNRQLKNTMYLSRSPTSTGYPAEREFLGGVHSNSQLRQRYTIDPIGRFYAGPYRLELRQTDVLSSISSKLVYRTRWDSEPKTYTDLLVGSGIGYSLPSCRYLYDAERHREELINNCIKGAKGQLVNLAVFIAELSQTGDLLADKARRVASAAGDVRKGKFSRAARTLGVKKPKSAKRNKSFANNWLEFSYGWAPLITDSVGLLRHIQRGARSLKINARSRSSSSVPLTNSSQVEQGYTGISMHRLLTTWKYVGTWERCEAVHLVFRPSSAFWDQVSTLGFMDPGLIAWETIPLSFVVDWFANVGDLLSDLNTGLTLEYVTGSYSELHRHTGKMTGSSVWMDQKAADYTYVSSNHFVQPVSLNEVKFVRQVIPEAQVAVSLVLSVPTSINQAISAIALAVQRLK